MRRIVAAIRRGDAWRRPQRGAPAKPDASRSRCDRPERVSGKASNRYLRPWSGQPVLPA